MPRREWHFLFCVYPQSIFFCTRFIPTACTQSWDLSTPRSYTFWAFEPRWSGLTLWWFSFSPYQTVARTTSGAWACLVDWREAWTASAMKRGEKRETRWENERTMLVGKEFCRNTQNNPSRNVLCESESRNQKIWLIETTWPKLRNRLVLECWGGSKNVFFKWNIYTLDSKSPNFWKLVSGKVSEFRIVVKPAW